MYLFSQKKSTEENLISPGANYLILKEDVILELNKPIEIKEFLDTNYTILEYPEIDFKKVGKQEIRFLVASDNGVEEVKKEIEIIDKTNPVIEIFEKEISIVEGESIKIEDKFKVSDEQEYKIIISEYSLDKPGKQEVKIIASDLSNNQSEAIIVLNIKEKPNVSVTDTPPSTSGNNNTRATNSVTSNSNSTSTVQPSKPKLSPKYYLYKNGYNRKTGFSTCVSENNIYENGGGCILYYEDGKEVGYQYQP